MSDILTLHRRALDMFGRYVHAVRPDQWTATTPCTDWDVRALIGHLVNEQLWVPPLLSGRTIEEVGDRFDGDVLGDDPVGAWEVAARNSAGAVGTPDALARPVHLSYGNRPADGYVQEMTMDLVVHSWDLARAIGADEKLDPELVEAANAYVQPRVAEWSGTGLFAAPVEVPANADVQTALLAAVGRRN